MKLLDIKGFNFKVAEYQIFRVTQYAKEHNVFYAPDDMKFFKIKDFENPIEFENHTYSQQSWIGITKYSEQKEKISHNMHFDICGQKDDFPVVNSFGVCVHNIHNEYLVWELKDCAPLYDEEFPILEDAPNFDEPIYLIKMAKSEDLSDEIFLTCGGLKKAGFEITHEDIEKIEDAMYRPFEYIKINGIDKSGQGCDCTKVTIGSWCYYSDADVCRISREFTEFNEVSDAYDRHIKTKKISKDIFDKVYSETIQKINA